MRHALSSAFRSYAQYLASIVRGRTYRTIRDVVASASLTYLLLLSFPQLLFAYEVSHGAFKVYSREPLDPSIHRILDGAAAKLLASGIHDDGVAPRIFIADSHRLYTFLGVYVGRNSFAKSYPVLPTSNVFVNMSDPAHDLVLRDAPANTERSLSGVIAHEVAHLLVRKKFGYFKHLLFPTWKLEGYAEYVAGGTLLDHETGARKWTENPADDAGYRYFKYYMLVKYLIEVKKLSVDNVFTRSIDVRSLEREVLDSLRAQNNPDWTDPFPPFKIAGNLYYVGTKGLAHYLITTPQGHILINSGLEANVPLIRANVETLGFKFSDIKILLISHAHWDHNAASEIIKKLTGAQYMVMDGDVSVVESGGKTDFHYADDPSARYPATKVDRALRDGDEVRLGGAVLVAHLTPGHTKGCTTWTMKVQENGKTYNVVIVGSPNVNAGFRLVNNTAYPQIASDYERMFRVLKSLPVDIFLGAHGSYFDLEAKYDRLKGGAREAFVDPEGYKTYVAEREEAFKRELAKQKRAP